MRNMFKMIYNINLHINNIYTNMSSPQLVRTLSHVRIAEQFAEPFKKMGVNGDTILNNYFIRDSQIVFSYLKNIQGDWMNYTENLPLCDFLKLKWTYDGCPNKINDLI